MVEVGKANHHHDDFVQENIVTGKTSNSGIILRPQPTNDPNEPLVRMAE